MKLISLNAYNGSKHKELLKYLKQEEPDILLLQEVWDFNGDRGSIFNLNTEVFNVISLMEENFKDYYSVFSPVLDTKVVVEDDIKVQGYYGNAIYIKFPIIKNETFFFDLEYAKDFLFPRSGVSFDNQPRNIIKLKLNTPTGLLNISNIHGIYQLNGYKGDSERVLGMVDTVLEVQNRSVPTVIAGDFNLEQNTESVRRMKNVYRELVTENDIESTKVNLNQVIDYMFVNNNIKVEKFDVDNVEISDHYPMVLEFYL